MTCEMQVYHETCKMQVIILKCNQLAKCVDLADLRVLGPLEHAHVVDPAVMERHSCATDAP
ncbi:MAG: hypothetical protein EBY28_00810 [Betaproteobacteria bacterium]|nr:hypothetical protein [Betaproteobacteria bacterium]